MVCTDAWGVEGFYGSEGPLPSTCDEWFPERTTAGKSLFCVLEDGFDTKNYTRLTTARTSIYRKRLR